MLSLMIQSQNKFLTVMLGGRVLSSLKRLYSSNAVPSAAPLSSINNPHAPSEPASEVKEDQILDPPNDKKFYVKKITRPRVALLLCFHGANYYGMQYNSHGPAIENFLFDAFCRLGILPEENKKNVTYHLGYSRASRTDRGVSALRQVVSFRITRGTNIDNINEFLPDDIRVLGMKRVNMVFDSQTWCYARSYCYIMPTYALCHFLKSCDPCHNYRIDADTLLKTSQIFQMFRGNHKFHNYTEKRDIFDSRSRRKIIDTRISNPFMIGDIEMIEFNIKGQSFMLHQIRRMIGMVIAIMRGKAHFHMLQETLEHPMMPAPTAPALGLILEKQHYDHYNRKYGTTDPLTWDEYDDQVEKFKLEKIVPHMMAVEQEERHMEYFLNEKLRRHSFGMRRESSKLQKFGEWNSVEEIEKLLDADGSNRKLEEK